MRGYRKPSILMQQKMRLRMRNFQAENNRECLTRMMKVSRSRKIANFTHHRLYRYHNRFSTGMFREYCGTRTSISLKN